MSIDEELQERAGRGSVRGAEEVWASRPVQAALRRKKVPRWVVPVLVVLPVWAVVYVGGLSPSTSGEPSQLEQGATLFSQRCAGCHGVDGGGGSGPQLSDGDVLVTFPDIVGQLEFVHQGSSVTGPRGTPYGDPDRAGGPRSTQGFSGAVMPPFGDSLTGAELLAVVRYEREVLAGGTVAIDQLAPDGSLLWPGGAPMLDDAGQMIGPDGRPLFDPDGSSTVEPDWTDPVGGSG